MENDSKPVLETELNGDLVGHDEPDQSAEIEEAAKRIRGCLAQTVENIIAIGRDLIMVKKRLGHGDFLKWIVAEFGMTRRSATNFMTVAERIGEKWETVSHLQPTALYALAAPSTPDEVVEKVLQQAADGKTISKEVIVAMKRELAGPTPNRRTSHHRLAKKTADPEPIGLANITTADLVAELERRAKEDGRDEVHRLLAPLIDSFYIPNNIDRRGASTGATASPDDAKPLGRNDAPVVDPLVAEKERSAPRSRLDAGSPSEIRATDEGGDRA